MWQRSDPLCTGRLQIILMVDNCTAHCKMTLNNIKLVFLPPNTTSVLQPMDQGVIKCLKGYYRKKKDIPTSAEHNNDEIIPNIKNQDHDKENEDENEDEDPEIIPPTSKQALNVYNNNMFNVYCKLDLKNC